MSTALAQAPPSDTTRRLYERHSSRIFGFCLSRLGSREDAEDAVQTTFLNAQRGLGRGVVPEYELAWLFKIAQNVCHNRHQSAKRRRCVESPHDLDSLQDLIASPERGAGASLGELTRALGTIPTRQRRALLLREFQGYSYEEIASELGTTVAAVETLVFRARRAMAQQLEQAGATQRRGRSAVAAVFELCRWLFRGGAAPLKVAAVAATVATATSLAIAPVGPDSTPAGPVAQKPEKVTAALPRPVQLRRLPDPSAPRRTSFRPRVVRDSTLPLAPSPVLTLPKPSAPAAPSRASRPAVDAKAAPAPAVTAPDPAASALTLPAITVPEVAVPRVQLPDVKVPEVELPTVQLPDLQLPKLP